MEIGVDRELARRLWAYAWNSELHRRVAGETEDAARAEEDAREMDRLIVACEKEGVEDEN